MFLYVNLFYASLLFTDFVPSLFLFTVIKLCSVTRWVRHLGFFLAIFTIVHFFHGLLPCLRFYGPNCLFCNNISRNFCVPLCVLFHACLLISRISQNEKFLTGEKGIQARKRRREEPLNFCHWSNRTKYSDGENDRHDTKP